MPPQTFRLPPEQFRAWRERMGLRFDVDVAERLGASRNTIKKWEDGITPIPLYVALACAAIAHGVPPIGIVPVTVTPAAKPRKPVKRKAKVAKK